MYLYVDMAALSPRQGVRVTSGVGSFTAGFASPPFLRPPHQSAAAPIGDLVRRCTFVRPYNLHQQDGLGVWRPPTPHDRRDTTLTPPRGNVNLEPQQAMTIFKLVDRDTGEESVEYAPEMVFQRSCPSCIHLKVWCVVWPLLRRLPLIDSVWSGVSVSLFWNIYLAGVFVSRFCAGVGST